MLEICDQQGVAVPQNAILSYRVFEALGRVGLLIKILHENCPSKPTGHDDPIQGHQSHPTSTHMDFSFNIGVR
jgi:hypothetical protein